MYVDERVVYECKKSQEDIEQHIREQLMKALPQVDADAELLSLLWKLKVLLDIEDALENRRYQVEE